jgi:hypothetical protein
MLTLRAAEEGGEGEAQAGDAQPAAVEQQQQQEGDEAGQRGPQRPNLDEIVDLSQLDLSILQQPARMPPLARVS